MFKLAPSILSADFTILGEQIRTAEKAGADYLHIDVMDGEFVPSISFGMPVIASIRKVTDLPFDVHLMIQKPERLIPEIAAAGADRITVQAEACTHLHRTICQIKECGKKAGVALNPSTALSALDYILKEIDQILIMSVNPGYGGQLFIPAMYHKIQETKARIQNTEGHIELEVDGGISLLNAEKAVLFGADVLVAGTAVFHGDIHQNIRQFKEIFYTV